MKLDVHQTTDSSTATCTLTGFGLVLPDPDLDLLQVWFAGMEFTARPGRPPQLTLPDPQFQLGGALDAVEVGVHQRHAARVLVHQRERGAGDVAVGRHLDAHGQALHERRLAGAERAHEAHDVTRAQDGAEAPPQRLHLVGGRRAQREEVGVGWRLSRQTPAPLRRCRRRPA